MEQVQKDSLMLFPCPGCNAQLYFSPEHQQLECEYCGVKVAIDNGADRVKENSLRQQMSETGDPAVLVEQQVYKCERCGSQTVFISDTPTFICSFCNFEVVNPVAYKTRLIQPSGIIPFAIDQQKSISIFKAWLGNGWWAPRDLSTFARQDALHGIYVPFWTYDAETYSQWSGYGGRYYYVTVSDTDANGNRTSRQERRTEWIYREGDYQHVFDDILIGGATELSQKEYESIYPYNLEEVVNFDARYMSGFKADVYDIAVHEGYEKAEQFMQQVIHEGCAEQCRIDTYRDLQVNTSYENQTYKHILLPLWVCSYVYKTKNYHFLINGQTGKIYGKKPVSAAKVTLAVILILLLILTIYYFSQQ
jgi:DNA-directed RNA polymerase subunit RPC12/RpoP